MSYLVLFSHRRCHCAAAASKKYHKIHLQPTSFATPPFIKTATIPISLTPLPLSSFSYCVNTTGFRCQHFLPALNWFVSSFPWIRLARCDNITNGHAGRIPKRITPISAFNDYFLCYWNWSTLIGLSCHQGRTTLIQCHRELKVGTSVDAICIT